MENSGQILVIFTLFVVQKCQKIVVQSYVRKMVSTISILTCLPNYHFILIDDDVAVSSVMKPFLPAPHPADSLQLIRACKGIKVASEDFRSIIGKLEILKHLTHSH